jgi:hypothetical protein
MKAFLFSFIFFYSRLLAFIYARIGSEGRAAGSVAVTHA